MERGVTVAEFARMCALHMPRTSSPVPLYSVREFLERCCDLGLMEHSYDSGGTTRYVPTHALRSGLWHEA